MAFGKYEVNSGKYICILCGLIHSTWPQFSLICLFVMFLLILFNTIRCLLNLTVYCYWTVQVYCFLLHTVDPFGDINWEEVSKSFPKNPEDAWSQSTSQTNGVDVWGESLSSVPASNGLADNWPSNNSEYFLKPYLEATVLKN